MDDKNKELLYDYRNTLRELKRLRYPHEKNYIDCSIFYEPTLTESFKVQDKYRQYESSKSSIQVFTSVCQQSARDFTGIVVTQIAPQNTKWHSFVAMNEEINSRREVQLYLEQVRDLLFKERLLPGSGFTESIWQMIRSMAVFGTGVQYIDWSDGLRYKTIPLSQCFIAENHQRQVDTLYRVFGLTYRQILQKFGKDFDEKWIETNKSKPEEIHMVVHATHPSSDYDEAKMDSINNYKYDSCYFLDSEDIILKKERYFDFPYNVARYDQDPLTPYGTGPGIVSVTSALTLHTVIESYLVAAELATKPPILTASTNEAEAFRTIASEGIADKILPGLVSPEGRPLAMPLQTGQVAQAREILIELTREIKELWSINQFNSLEDRTQRMSASEANIRANDANRIVSPQIERLAISVFNGMIRREVKLLEQNKYFENNGIFPPEILKRDKNKQKVKIVYAAPVNVDMNKQSISSIKDMIGFTKQLAQVSTDPEEKMKLDKAFDIDKVLRYIANGTNIPVSLLSDPELVQKSVDGMKQAQEQQKIMEAAPAAAGIIKAISPQGLA